MTDFADYATKTKTGARVLLRFLHVCGGYGTQWKLFLPLILLSVYSNTTVLSTYTTERNKYKIIISVTYAPYA